MKETIIKKFITKEFNEMMDFINNCPLSNRDKSYYKQLFSTVASNLMARVKDWNFHYNRVMRNKKKKK